MDDKKQPQVMKGAGVPVPTIRITMLPQSTVVDVDVQNCSASEALAIVEHARASLVEACIKLIDQRQRAVVIPGRLVG